MSKDNNIIDLKMKRPLHPVLKQALYVVPKCIQHDAWWLTDEPSIKLNPMYLSASKGTQDGK